LVLVDTPYAELNRSQHESVVDSFTPTRYAQFERWIPAQARLLLDLGCGVGRGGKVLKALRPELTLVGLDCLEERVAALPAGVYSAYVCSLSTRMPFDTAQFDAITAGEFIEHLTPDDAVDTLAECARVLKVDGTLILTTPHPAYLLNRLRGVTALGGAHLALYHPREIRAMLRAAGFNSVRLRGSGRVSNYLGAHFPFLCVYGSYLAAARRS
jgi:2-polyprenyl-3-methyl-5-hydroxy-6-metoxy-1,4-benzoquinol methylase